jgi:hypothetical protein
VVYAQLTYGIIERPNRDRKTFDSGVVSYSLVILLHATDQHDVIMHEAYICICDVLQLITVQETYKLLSINLTYVSFKKKPTEEI